MRYALGFFFTIIFIFSFGSNASACRFNVRDVGFVHLDKAPYRLYGYYNNTTPKNRVSDFQQIAMANCIESNIVAEFVNVEEEAAHPGLAYYNKSILPALPGAMFVSPDGQTRPVKIQADGRPFKKAVWDAMRPLLHSPLREKILRAVIDSYAVILLVEGRDKRENAMAQKDIKNAITEIEGQMDFLPKPIKNPPQCIVLPQEKQEQEEVLLWSLGLEPYAIKDPVAFVLYGRGRRMGPAMRHQSLTHEQIRKRLGLIGLSCECGLDRSWMQGAMIPHQWDISLQKKV
ncbi:hypothetical protein GF373_05415, partial [bacterium]|nr:hypothetical protein [bacterium]